MKAEIHLQSLHTSLSYKMLKMKRGKCKKIKKNLANKMKYAIFLFLE